MQTTAIKKARAIILTVSSLVFSATAFDAQAQQMRGSPSCGSWVSRSTNSVGAHGQEMWLLGYLSGLASGSGKDILRGTDNESLELWVDNYCRANPLKKIFDAGDALFIDLLKQKKL